MRLSTEASAAALVKDRSSVVDNTHEDVKGISKETDAMDVMCGFTARGSFTQPTKFEELLVGTQVPCTPGASQVGTHADTHTHTHTHTHMIFVVGFKYVA